MTSALRSSAPSKWARFYYTFRHMPRGLRYSAGVLLLLGLAAGGYYRFAVLPGQRQQQHLSRLWSQFDAAAKTGTEAEMQWTLEEILRMKPDDPLAASRLAALRNGSADESDPVMPLLTMPKHLAAGRWPEADREAAKRLAHQPKDWLARCARAKAALERGDRAAAARELDQLPDPMDSASRVTPATLLFALDIFRQLERDPSGLRRFIRDAVVDTSRSAAAESFPVPVKIQLIECYLEGFEPSADRQPVGLSRAVEAVGRLVDLCLGDAAIDGASLLKLGNACDRLVLAFALLHRERQITDDQYQTIVREHDARTVRAWRMLLERDPKAASAYHGIANSALRAGDGALARREVIRGLAACGENAQLLALFALLLREDDHLLPAAGSSLQAAEKDPNNISLWVIAAEMAEAAGRRDIALDACAKARALHPNNPWAIRTEARILIEAGGPYVHTGVQLLASLGDQLPGDPQAARLYVRGLNEAGLESLIEAFLKKVEAESLKRGSPGPIAQALRGLADSRYQPALADLALSRCKSMLDRFPNDLELATVEAMTYFRGAAQGEPRWNSAKTNGAILGFERLHGKSPDNLEIAAALAWLHLKGENKPAQALRDSAPLATAAERGQPLTVWQWQVLGAAELANGHSEAAIRVLEQGRRFSKAAPGILIPLALAYHGQGKREQARAALDAASALPRTGQDQADYLDAFATMKRENK